MSHLSVYVTLNLCFLFQLGFTFSVSFCFLPFWTKCCVIRVFMNVVFLGCDPMHVCVSCCLCVFCMTEQKLYASKFMGAECEVHLVRLQAADIPFTLTARSSCLSLCTLSLSVSCCTICICCCGVITVVGMKPKAGQTVTTV